MPRRRPILAMLQRLPRWPEPGFRVSPDAWSLLAIGLLVTYVLGLARYRMGERGWPGWLRRIAPDWFPGPTDVLEALPFVAVILACSALIRMGRVVRVRGGRLPRVCWIALIAALVSWVHALYMGRFGLPTYTRWTIFTALSLAAVLEWVSAPFARWRLLRNGQCDACRRDASAPWLNCVRCRELHSNKPVFSRSPLPPILTRLVLGAAVLTLGGMGLFRWVCSGQRVHLSDLGRAYRQTYSLKAHVQLRHWADFVTPAATWLAWVGLAGAVVLLAMAIRRRDGRTAQSAVRLALALMLAGVLAYQFKRAVGAT